MFLYKNFLKLFILIFLGGFFSSNTFAALVFTNEENGTHESQFYIDSADVATDFIDLEFGSSIDAKLRFDIVNNKFVLNRDFHINNNLQLDGTFADKDGDVGLTGQVLASTITGTNWITNSSNPIPFISTENTTTLNPSTTDTIIITGNNFTPSTTVSIPGFDGTINSTSIISSTQLEFEITTGTTQTTYDIVLSNNGVLNTEWSGNGVGLLKVEIILWKLFAISDSSHCAELLPYGPNAITEASNAYFSTENKAVAHTQFKQVFKVDDVEKFSIIYDFGNSKTLEDRFNTATVSGESVTWTVTQGANQYTYGPHLFYYSDGANVSGKWNGSGTNWSGDDGSWGAADNNVDGNGGPYETWGHGNHNSGDTSGGMCGTYQTNGSSTTSSGIRSYMYMQ